MAALGVDTDEAARSGRLVALDAAATLAKFKTGETADPAAFDAVIGGLVRDSTAGGRAVRAYGEMVALLWQAGEVAAAIELEGLWNELRSRTPFALLCGYPSHVLSSTEQDTAAVLSVCHLHSEVAEFAPTGAAGPIVARAERRFVASSRAPRAARQFVHASLETWGCHDVAGAAALAVTELVSNAVVHAQSDVSVHLTAVRGAVRIGVRDNSSATPAPRHATTDEASGRGLALVAALADRWGTELHASGKTVWVEFVASAALPAPA
jgi:anti-sigma regulatory factor (Ser/Thr protein kinase)